MNQLKEILTAKAIAERKEIMLENLKECEKELALWQSFFVMNHGEFSPSQVATCLRRAKELVNELLSANVE